MRRVLEIELDNKLDEDDVVGAANDEAVAALRMMVRRVLEI